MIKHIVMWSFADEAEGADKSTNLQLAQARLSALAGLVPGMGAFEAVVAQPGLEASYDLVLYSEFDSADALKSYATHPDHVAVAQFITRARTARVCMDYEV